MGIMFISSVRFIPGIYKKWAAAPKNWKLQTATILQAKVRSIDTYVEGLDEPIPDLFFCIDVEYEYKVGEKTYKGNGKFTNSAAGREIERNIALYKIGNTVQIFYNVDNPSMSIDTWPDGGTSALKTELSVVLIFLFIGLLMLLI